MSILDKFRLDGKVAVVTGAGRGIGAACAKAFAEAGADVVIGARTISELESVASEIEAMGRRAKIVKLDVMVAATIADVNLNKAIDSLSIGLTTTSITPSVLDGLITAEANWLFNNAVTSGTTSMTTAATNFYNTSTDTNVVNYKTLITELTAAWNAAKEPTLLLWFIEFVKEYENL